MPRDQALRIRRKLDGLARDPHSAPNVKKLTEHPGYRLRVGDWRVVYLLDHGRIVIQVIRIARRNEVLPMSVRILEANGKPAFAVLPYDEYQALRELADDAEDTAALIRFAKKLASKSEEPIPVAVVDRLLAGESPLRVWREHRGMTAAQVAAAVDITPAHVSKLESGKGDPSLSLLRRLAKVLQVSIEDLVGTAPAE